MFEAYIFDIDGTITPPRQPMDAGFAKSFSDWADDHVFYLITGSDRLKIEEQIPVEILNKAVSVSCCSGNDVYEYHSGRSDNIYKVELLIPHGLLDYLESELHCSGYSGPRFPPHFEHRAGLLNFSVVGRGAGLADREHYARFDEVWAERSRIADIINERFPTLVCSVGGVISIDITEAGRDKSQLLNMVPGDWELTFIADGINSGNDKCLADAIAISNRGKSVNVSGWQDVQRLLF